MQSTGVGGRWMLAILVFAALCLGGWTSYGEKQSLKPARATWEYKILQGVTEEQLNQLGAGGWELVAVAAGNGQVSHYFKRAR